MSSVLTVCPNGHWCECEVSNGREEGVSSLRGNLGELMDGFRDQRLVMSLILTVRGAGAKHPNWNYSKRWRGGEV